MTKMNDAVRLKKIVRSAKRLIDAIMLDQGGFDLITLHCMRDLGDLVGHPDHLPVTAVEGGWSMKGGDEVRFWGSAAMADVTNN